MKIDIISGFLGAGKTTLIKKLLAEELYKEKIAIIENEYGEVAIDGSLLSGEKVEVTEISSGCICCNIKGDFKESIAQIVKDYKPTRIIVEPTGVAKLSEIIISVKEANTVNAKINMIATVVDVNNFWAYLRNFGEFYKNQIVSAGVILLSRAADVTELELFKVAEEIRILNKTANIITTPWDKISAKRIIEVGEMPREKLVTEFKKATLKGKATVRIVHNANDVFDNWGVETSKLFDEATLKSLLNNLSKEGQFGKILRAKGIVPTKTGKWVQFDYVPGEVEIKRFSADYTGRVCVIGSNLNKKEIENLFLKNK
ncbi:GTP-binding protein [uncultured Clostridium sp.]|jgi:G3E family GTPase|uniref:CobW family GTP-binding protein n=1 Tax=uncultured Clostridium sp. TaxID=59620 RepID=UPI00260DEE28|nr:GTP-binding protein [uncultured Clostridium sp.]